MRNNGCKIGSARIDENGHARGGKAGDQTGREVSTQNWYNHSGGWRVFRPKDPAVAEKIAWDMQAACNNNNIGYDQGQRSNLYSVSKPLGFDCAKVNAKTETDCSALVRVCCTYAGVMLPDFNTASEASALLKSGAFTELTGAKYTASPDYERHGDILVTRKKGHTAVVLTNGPKAEPLPALAELASTGRGVVYDLSSAITTVDTIAEALQNGFIPEAYYVPTGSPSEETIFAEIRRLVDLGCTGLTLDTYFVHEAFEYLYDDLDARL